MSARKKAEEPISKRAEVGSFSASFQKVLLPFGLTVDQVILKSSRGVIDAKPFKIELDEPGTVEVIVLQEDLADFLNKRQPGGLRDFSIKLTGGQILVRATARFIVDLPAMAVCTLEIREDGRELFVVLQGVDVMGMGAKSLVEGQLEKINPILDVKDFPLDIRFRSVVMEDGKLTVHGTAMPPA